MADDPLDPPASSPAPEPQPSPSAPGGGGGLPPGGVAVATAPEDAPLEVPKEQRTWGMIAHLAGLVGVIVLPGIGCVLGPLIVWIVKKDEMPFVDDQGKEALNFQLTILITHLVLGGLLGMLWWTIVIPCILGPVWLIVWGVQIVFSIIAAIQANDGRRYRYPLAVRLV